MKKSLLLAAGFLCFPVLGLAQAPPQYQVVPVKTTQVQVVQVPTLPTTQIPAPAPGAHYYYVPVQTPACASCGTGAGGAAPQYAAGYNCPPATVVVPQDPNATCKYPANAFKQRCAEIKARCNANSCSANKKLGEFGCGSWRQDCIFIFGSCHDFFGEPCRKLDR